MNVMISIGYSTEPLTVTQGVARVTFVVHAMNTILNLRVNRSRGYD